MAGQIEKRGEGVYRVRLFLGRDGKGKRRYLSRTVHGRKKDAERLLARLLRERDTGELVDAAGTTMDAFLDDWLEAVKLRVRARTAKDYAGIVERYIRPALGHEYVAHVNASKVLRLYTSLHERGLSVRTIRQVHEVMGNLLESAVEDRFLAGNPARSRAVRRAIPKAKRTERRTVRPDEVPAFLAACEADPFGALWSLLLFGGLRPEEALALRWSDLHADRVRVARVLVERGGLPLHYEEPKSETSRRTVPVPPPVVALLKAQRVRVAEMRLFAGAKWKDEDLIFPNLTGGPLRQGKVRRAWDAFRERAGLPDMRLYDLRHSTATLAIEAGVPLKAVSEMLGHASEALVLKTYGHVTPGMREHAAERLGALARTRRKRGA